MRKTACSKPQAFGAADIRNVLQAQPPAWCSPRDRGSKVKRKQEVWLSSAHVSWPQSEHPMMPKNGKCMLHFMNLLALHSLILRV